MVLGEPEREQFFEISSGTRSRMSVASWVETCLVVDNRSAHFPRQLDLLIETLEVELVDVTPAIGRAARTAHRRFGRGSGSPARLSFGDCFAYALSVTSGEPLLFKGADFTHTDVISATG